MKRCDVAIIGAGPYGLSVAAHLRARGLHAVVFGQPMSFWDQQMPAGMLLRSPIEGSDLSDPDGKLSLEIYRDSTVREFTASVPVKQFVQYGLWFQRQTATDLDTRKVSGVQKNGTFELTLTDGEKIKASRVVVAAGIASFPERPKQFAGFPNTIVSHSSEHNDFAPFKNRKVAVIGAGQSGLESAALLNEAGAEVELLVRSKQVAWLRECTGIAAFPAISRLLWAPTGVGSAGFSQLIARPKYFRMLPRWLQSRFYVHQPAGTAWLRPRVEKKMPISAGRTVVSAKRNRDQVKLTLDDGRECQVDHVLLATGYRVDISRYEFLKPQMLTAINTADGYPRLNSAFECSVPGLHFVGAPAAWSFGPLMKFVAGTRFTAKTVTNGIVAGKREIVGNSGHQDGRYAAEPYSRASQI